MSETQKVPLSDLIDVFDVACEAADFIAAISLMAEEHIANPLTVVAIAAAEKVRAVKDALSTFQHLA